MPVDETDALKGFIAIREKTSGGCFGCAFSHGSWTDCPKFPNDTVMCLPNNRADERSVIFIKRKEPANG